MDFTTIKIAGAEAIQTLNDYRSSYAKTGEYPFLIGDDEELDRLRDASQYNKQDFAEILRRSFEIDPAAWIAEHGGDLEEDGLSDEEVLGEWPGEVAEKVSIGVHTDILSGQIKREVYLGLAAIEQPWH